MKIWSSKKSAMKNIKDMPKEIKIMKECTGQYKTSIKEFESSRALALYKSYRQDKYGKYVIIMGIYPIR